MKALRVGIMHGGGSTWNAVNPLGIKKEERETRFAEEPFFEAMFL